MWIVTEASTGDIKLHAEDYAAIREFIENNDFKIGIDGHVSGKRWELQDPISRKTKFILECTEEKALDRSKNH